MFLFFVTLVGVMLLYIGTKKFMKLLVDDILYKGDFIYIFNIWSH